MEPSARGLRVFAGAGGHLLSLFLPSSRRTLIRCLPDTAGALLFHVGLRALLPFPLRPLKSVLLGLSAPWIPDNSRFSQSFKKVYFILFIYF